MQTFRESTRVVIASTVALVLAGMAGVATVKAAGFDTLELRVDRSADGKTKTVSMKLDEFEAIAKKQKACLNLVVYLDGKSDFDVMFSTEGQEERDNVGCRPDAYGTLPMGDGIEYYVRSQSEGARMDLSIFPGSRSLNPYNDVACVPGGTIDPVFDAFAAVRIRGFYTVITNDFGAFTAIQLRAANPPVDADIDACLKTFK